MEPIPASDTNASARQIMTRILVTTGPESSGKTTLATRLSGALQAPLVSEASRDYLTELYRHAPDRRYGQQDLLAIARLQLAREQEALLRAPPVLVCDTDLLVIVVWSEVKYGGCEPALLDLFRKSLAGPPRAYLLCNPEMPWQPDPLRENPHDRLQLLERYRTWLQQLDHDWLLASGDEDTRCRQVMQRLG
jgi:nicotinamide riboside kinase